MLVKVGDFLFRYRNYVGPAAFVAAVLLSRPAFPFGSQGLNLVFDLAGFALALAGQLLRILTIGHKYIVRGGRNRRVYADDLVQEGMFALCRNPLYLGNLLIAFGLALVIHAWAFYLIVLPGSVLAYMAIVAAEEAFLERKFGAEYGEYARHVPRWLPRLARYRDAVAGRPFQWKRVVAKEYNTTFILVLVLLCTRLWSNCSVLGREALPSGNSFATSLLAWIAVYLTVWTLKKRGYFQERAAAPTI